MSGRLRLNSPRIRAGQLFLLAITMALALTGCASEPETIMREIMVTAVSGRDDYEEVAAYDTDTASAPGGDTQTQERLIIRNADLSIVVDETKSAIDAIEAVVDRSGGWVVNSNVWEYSGVKRGNISVRVPAEQLDAFLQEIHSLATEVTSESISGQDVTEEYVDLQAQLSNLQTTADRVRSFMDEAETVEEALAVNSELSRLEGEIERITGRIQYLEGSARFSAVSIDITPDELNQPIVIGRWEPQGTARDAIEALISTLQWLVDALIVIVLYVLPVLLVVGGPIYLLIRFLRRRRARRRASARQASTEIGQDQDPQQRTVAGQ